MRPCHNPAFRGVYMSRKPSDDETVDMFADTWTATATGAQAETDFDAQFLAYYEGVYRLL
jgi:hypothetical protein